MLQEIDQIDGMLKNLLLLSRPPAVHPVSTDVATLVEEVLLMSQAECSRRGVAVERALAPGLPPVPVDPGMFRHLVYNLVTNGMQAMPEGGRLRVAVDRAGPGQVMLEVVDTGAGILPENLERLFQPFFTTKAEGTGLGLAVCQWIANAHGGSISASSEGGKGTTFRVLLPVPE